jgi:hypothetical protein
MGTLLLVLIGNCLFIVATEAMLHALYSRKVAGINFGEEKTIHGLTMVFTVGRVRILTLLHTVMLCVVTGAAILFLW